jgi:UDP-N-acetylglucosamine:LPS N-acetylglucosamine transferase
MHLIKDENGNVIPHGADHHHSHEGCQNAHSHEDCHHCQSDCKDETVALLAYMVQHNEHHAAELDQMAENLAKLGMEDAAKTIREGVSDFQKANLRFSLALTQVKEALKDK